jgi:hypothetical protein
MEQGKPITTFLITALILWAIYLWKHGRLGKPGLLPSPGMGGGKPAPASATVPPLVMPKPSDVGPLQVPNGWQQGQPNVME